MDRREFMGSAARATAAGAAALAAARLGFAEAGATRPNIIFIMADDLGYANLGCYGQKEILTPHVDQLAGEGVRFTQCYAGSTVCAPSRSCLMTGQHTGHTTVRGNASAIGKGRIPLKASDVTVAEVLRPAGYTTGIIGKWGLGEPGTAGVPNKQGFDHWFGYLNQRHAHEYYPDYLWRNDEKVELPGNKRDRKRDYSHDLFTEEALRFVRKHQAGPFFLYLPYTIPHLKLQVPSLEPYEDKPWHLRFKQVAAMITRLDRDVGRLMALLKELRIDENTIVFFTSDNGGVFSGKQWTLFKSNGPLRGGKGGLTEGGLRVPMIARWPGKIQPGRTSDQVWAFWDVLPTLAELAGARPPEGIDGLSMAPAILGLEQKQQHEFLYWEFSVKDRFTQAVRIGDWKAIRAGTQERMRLHDLSTDMGERRDVAAKHRDVVRKIQGLMRGAHTDSMHWPSHTKRKPSDKGDRRKAKGKR